MEPVLAVISAGDGNRYGLPPSTLAALGEISRAYRVYRTDRSPASSRRARTVTGCLSAPRADVC